MKRIILATLIMVGLCGPALAQDTFHVFKDSAVNVTQPGQLTQIAYLNLVVVGDYMVVAKTEIQNNGTSNHVTCDLQALDAFGRVTSGDPVSTWVAAGKFAPVALTIVAHSFGCAPESCPLIRVRCGSLWTTQPTNLQVRQTKITAHKVNGLQIIGQ